MPHILLAEDDNSLRHFITASLEKAGYTVTSFSNGLEACAALESGQIFDLLLTDIVMPGMDGIELSSRAAALTPTPKVMFITGFAAMALKDGQAQGSLVISKPFHLGNLIEQVGNILKI